MQQLILRAQFIDRAGRTVYSVNVIEVTADPENPEQNQMREGPAVGLIRLTPLENDEASVEWFQEPPRPEPGPPQAELPPVPGVQRDGTG